ncbi:hypothetical protein BGX33_012161 [Mortierella sp. NVP41]|nr:hypothetical protein BGX33_012161 [Mortierella sp. NVP41]
MNNVPQQHCQPVRDPANPGHDLPHQAVILNRHLVLPSSLQILEKKLLEVECEGLRELRVRGDWLSGWEDRHYPAQTAADDWGEWDAGGVDLAWNSEDQDPNVGSQTQSQQQQDQELEQADTTTLEEDEAKEESVLEAATIETEIEVSVEGAGEAATTEAEVNIEGTGEAEELDMLTTDAEETTTGGASAVTVTTTTVSALAEPTATPDITITSDDNSTDINNQKDGGVNSHNEEEEEEEKEEESVSDDIVGDRLGRLIYRNRRLHTLTLDVQSTATTFCRPQILFPILNSLPYLTRLEIRAMDVTDQSLLYRMLRFVPDSVKELRFLNEEYRNSHRNGYYPSHVIHTFMEEDDPWGLVKKEEENKEEEEEKEAVMLPEWRPLPNLNVLEIIDVLNDDAEATEPEFWSILRRAPNLTTFSFRSQCRGRLVSETLDILTKTKYFHSGGLPVQQQSPGLVHLSIAYQSIYDLTALERLLTLSSETLTSLSFYESYSIEGSLPDWDGDNIVLALRCCSRLKHLQTDGDSYTQTGISLKALVECEWNARELVSLDFAIGNRYDEIFYRKSQSDDEDEDEKEEDEKEEDEMVKEEVVVEGQEGQVKKGEKDEEKEEVADDDSDSSSSDEEEGPAVDYGELCYDDDDDDDRVLVPVPLTKAEMAATADLVIRLARKVKACCPHLKGRPGFDWRTRRQHLYDSDMKKFLKRVDDVTRHDLVWIRYLYSYEP